MIVSLRTAALTLALLTTAPLLAQPAPPPPPAATHHDERPYWSFPGMSEPGRRSLMEAMRPGAERDRADRDRVRAARDRMLDVLAAERLDSAALRRAMDDERDAANAMKTRRQAAMLQALQGLSAADRKAFVDDARSLRGRFEERTRKWRDRTGGAPVAPPV